MQDLSIQREPQNPTPNPQPVGKSRFSSTRTQVRGQSKKIWLILALVIIIIIAGTLFMFSRPKSESEEQPPKEEETTLDTFSFEEEGEETPSPSPSEQPVDKEKVVFSVLNGTGIAKQAALLEEELIKLGYKNITVGNAEVQDKDTTKVTFSLDVPNQVRQEVFDRLEEIYQRVETETKDVDNADILIVVGLRKGQELPSPTPTQTSTSDSEEESTSSANN